MVDIQDMLDRAMLLNLSDCFLDSDECIYINEDHRVVLYLDNYIKNNKEPRIEIPEIISVVHMFEDLDVYDNIKCTIVFPESVLYVGNEGYLEGAINFHMIGTQYVVDLQGLTLDFEKSSKLQCVNPACFYGLNIGNIYFGPSVWEFQFLSFKDTNIKRLYAPGVYAIQDNTFADANIGELKLGSLIYMTANCFNDANFEGKELVISDEVRVDLTHCMPHAARIYMPYDLDSGRDMTKEELDKLKAKIDKLTLTEIIHELYNLTDLLKINYGNFYKGADILYAYLYGNRDKEKYKNSIMSDCLMLYRYIRDLSGCSMYLYKARKGGKEDKRGMTRQGKERDVHKIAYTFLGTDNGLSVYLEE